MRENTLIFFSFVFLFISDFVERIDVNVDLPNATYIAALVKFLALLCLLKVFLKTDLRQSLPSKTATLFCILISWNVITILRGALGAQDYWDWKFLMLFSSFSLLIPLSIVVGLRFEESTKLFSFILRKLFSPLVAFGILILAVSFDRELFPRSLMALPFFILTIPFLPKYSRRRLIVLAIVSIFIVLMFRSNVLRVSSALGLVLVYNFRNIVGVYWLKLSSIFLYLAPFIFFLLAVTGQFNIFKIEEEGQSFAVVGKDGKLENLAGDTRTFLYEEVLSSMIKNSSILFGEGAAAKYETEYFASDDSTGRYGAEVGFLNTLLYSGLIGVLFHFVLLSSATFYGLCRSNNSLVKLIAVFLAFRWCMFFIEDIIKFDLNFFFLWCAVGLCLSVKFRRMTDSDIRSYFRYSSN